MRAKKGMRKVRIVILYKITERNREKGLALECGEGCLEMSGKNHIWWGGEGEATMVCVSVWS